MKIAVTAQGPTPESVVDQRFGRAYYLLFFDEDSGRWDPMNNAAGRNALQGAGIKAAQQVADQQAAVLLTGITGPKAFKALAAAGVKVFHGAAGTAQEAIQAYKKGQLNEGTLDGAQGRP